MLRKVSREGEPANTRPPDFPYFFPFPEEDLPLPLPRMRFALALTWAFSAGVPNWATRERALRACALSGIGYEPETAPPFLVRLDGTPVLLAGTFFL